MDPTLKVRQEISERVLRARHRLQARQEPRDLCGALLRRPLHPGPDRRQDVEVRHASATSSRSRSRKSSPASTPPCSARSRSIPNIKVKIIWVNSWFDPGKEADAAKALHRPGRRHPHPAHRLAGGDADRRAARHASPSARSSDMIKFGPQAQLTADHRQLGRLLHRARQGRARRQMEVGRHLGRPR